MGNISSDFSKIGKGLEDIFEGVISEAEHGAIGGISFVLDTFVIMQYVGAFIVTNFLCALQSITNLSSCFMYYIFDVIIQILYLPIAICIFILSLTGIKSYDFETQFFDQMEILDKYAYKLIGFHIRHYPKSVRDKCYVCKRMKMEALMQKISLYLQDIKSPIYGDLFFGLGEIFNGSTEMLEGFVDLIMSLIKVVLPMVEGIFEGINSIISFFS
jgi:hypothetical protein